MLQHLYRSVQRRFYLLIKYYAGESRSEDRKGTRYSLLSKTGSLDNAVQEFSWAKLLYEPLNHALPIWSCGGLMVSALVHGSSLVRALSGDTVLCSWARHFTLTAPLSTQEYK